jgi:hypothetical protein
MPFSFVVVIQTLKIFSQFLNSARTGHTGLSKVHISCSMQVVKGIFECDNALLTQNAKHVTSYDATLTTSKHHRRHFMHLQSI